MLYNTDHSDQPCDVTLTVKDGKQFKAHGNVLRKASSFFERILDGDWKESREGIIRLDTVNKGTMEDILEFIYTGNVDVCSMERAEDLITAVDYLLLPILLKDIATQFLEQSLSICNAFSIYYLAVRLERYRCEKMLAKVTEFIHSNFASASNPEEFLNLSSHEVEQWISSDDINISAEDDVFRIILKWIDHDKNERKKNFQDLFRHVRLSFVSRDCLLNEVSTNEFVQHDDTCLKVVMSILNGITGSTTDGNLSMKSPRNVFQIEALVARGENRTALIYLPDDDQWYQLQLPGFPSRQNHRPRLLSSKDKMFFFYSLYHNLESYNASLNYWTTDLEFTGSTNPAKEEEKSFRILTDAVSVVGDECIFLGRTYNALGPSANRESQLHVLFKHKLDSDSWEMISSFDWGRKNSVCFVFAERFLYAIGGRTANAGATCCAEATRFDTIEKKWEKIADIQDARYDACGISTGDSIFIAGGRNHSFSSLRTCEMYNVLTNEWQFVANLTIGRHLATMVCVDGMLYVLGGSPLSDAAIVECYDREKNEWKQKTTVPFFIQRRCGVTMQRYDNGLPVQTACSLRIFKGILSNLQSLQ